MTQFLDTKVDGEQLTREEILDICFLFLLAGLDTVTDSLTCSFAYLAQHPEHRQQIVDDPSIIPAAVEELLRWESPVPGVPRFCTEDTEVAGCPMKSGDMVGVSVGAANVDTERVPRRVRRALRPRGEPSPRLRRGSAPLPRVAPGRGASCASCCASGTAAFPSTS